MNIVSTVNVDIEAGMSVNQNLTIGDVMLLRPRYDHEPAITGNVSRVTKTQFRVTGSDGKEYGPFKLEGWNTSENLLEDGTRAEYDSTEPATCYTFKRFESAHKTYNKYDACYFSSEFVQKWLAEVQAKAIARTEEKAAAREKQQREYAEEKARQLAEVKAACGSLDGELPPMIKKIMPDGTRLYFTSVPVKGCYRERKAGWEELIVRVKEAQYYSNRLTGVESHYTYTNGSGSSFSSCSGQNYANDNDAIWDAISQCYHSW